ncbi:MAG: hypothetical protein ACMUIP_15225 [bacterium]
MQKWISSFLIFSFVLVFFTYLCFGATESETYRISVNVFSNGCAVMTSDNYINNITLGQPSALGQDVPIQSPSYDTYPGFWYTTFTPLSLFVTAYGSLSTDIHYVLECDMDKDGDVDGTDLRRFINQP